MVYIYMIWLEEILAGRNFGGITKVTYIYNLADHENIKFGREFNLADHANIKFWQIERNIFPEVSWQS